MSTTPLEAALAWARREAAAAERERAVRAFCLRARETLACIAGVMVGSAAVLITAGRWGAAGLALGACCLTTLAWAVARKWGAP